MSICILQCHVQVVISLTYKGDAFVFDGASEVALSPRAQRRHPRDRVRRRTYIRMRVLLVSTQSYCLRYHKSSSFLLKEGVVVEITTSVGRPHAA